MKNQPMICGSSKALSGNAFKRAGYEFVGWIDDKGNVYRNKQTVLNLTEEENGIVRLYAQWEAVEYPIAYKNISPFDTNNNPAVYSLTEPVDFNHLNVPERPGCVFAGWYIDSRFKKPAEAASFSAIGAKTLYAKWNTKLSYTIVFDANSESLAGTVNGTMKSMTKCLNGTVYTLRGNAYKVKGYTFLGWSIDPNAAEPTYGNKDRVGNLADTNDEVVTLYAIWKPTEYKITYMNVADARLENEEVFHSTYNIEVGYDLPVPLKEEFIFLGWYTTSTFKNGTRIYRIDPGAVGAMTVYAKWMLIHS